MGAGGPIDSISTVGFCQETSGLTWIVGSNTKKKAEKGGLRWQGVHKPEFLKICSAMIFRK